jgi:DNA-binding IclR family transcriptional regulator
VVYIDKIESDETVKVCMKIGQGIPLYCTGLGKSFLASMSHQAVKTIIGPGPYKPFTEKTITTFDELAADLDETRKRGYSIDDEEHFRGICCVAAPIYNAKGETIASLSVAVLKIYNGESEIDFKFLGQAVYDAAEGLTGSVGGQRPSHF